MVSANIPAYGGDTMADTHEMPTTINNAGGEVFSFSTAVRQMYGEEQSRLALTIGSTFPMKCLTVRNPPGGTGVRSRCWLQVDCQLDSVRCPAVKHRCAAISISTSAHGLKIRHRMKKSWLGHIFEKE
jgi:hypothetical protein